MRRRGAGMVQGGGSMGSDTTDIGVIAGIGIFLAVILWMATDAGLNGRLTQAAVRDSVQSARAVETAKEEIAPRVALTFDDGPHPTYTPALLDGLKEREIRATFFVIGKNIPGREEILRRMDEEGHLIGNHTYDHVEIAKLSLEEACSQIMKTNKLIRRITGKNAGYVRPPFGEWNREIECGIDLLPVGWSVDTLDWTTSNTAEIVERGTKNIEDGDIILMHDYYASSVEAALEIADILAEQGFQFVTADELILE